MLIDSQQIADGWHNGKTVWICDYQFRHHGKRALRHLTPTKVTIVTSTILDQTVRWSRIHYRSLAHFVGYDNRIYGLYANTSRWSRRMLYAFDNEDECIQQYRSLCVQNLDDQDMWLEQTKIEFQKVKDRIRNNFNRSYDDN